MLERIRKTWQRKHQKSFILSSYSFNCLSYLLYLFISGWVCPEVSLFSFHSSHHLHSLSHLSKSVGWWLEEWMIERRVRDRILLIAFSPFSFARDPRAESWGNWWRETTWCRRAIIFHGKPLAASPPFILFPSPGFWSLQWKPGQGHLQTSPYSRFLRQAFPFYLVNFQAFIFILFNIHPFLSAEEGNYSY